MQAIIRKWDANIFGLSPVNQMPQYPPPPFSQCEYMPFLQLVHLPHEVMHEIRT